MKRTDANYSAKLNFFQEMTRLANETGAINLSQGFPHGVFDDEWQEAICSQTGNCWQYTPTRGCEELLNEISFLYLKSDAFVTSGCTEALLCGLFAFHQMGYRQLVVPEPFYSYYPGMANLAGLQFSEFPLTTKGERLSFDLDQLERISTQESIFLVNSPHNPSGVVLDEQDWERLLELVRNKKSALLLDDVYRDFNYSKNTVPYEQILSANALVAGSVSKSYAGAGIRLGWLVGNGDALALAHSAHTNMSNCAPEIMQRAAVKILQQKDATALGSVRKAYAKRRDRLFHSLQKTGFSVYYPDGGHFIMAKWNQSPELSCAVEQSRFLTKSIGVAPLPLDLFFTANKERLIRFSFAVSDEDIWEACNRLSRLEGEDKFHSLQSGCFEI